MSITATGRRPLRVCALGVAAFLVHLAVMTSAQTQILMDNSAFGSESGQTETSLPNVVNQKDKMEGFHLEKVTAQDLLGVQADAFEVSALKGSQTYTKSKKASPLEEAKARLGTEEPSPEYLLSSSRSSGRSKHAHTVQFITLAVVLVGILGVFVWVTENREKLSGSRGGGGRSRRRRP
ncbi:MAG: hypothetical protein MI923_30930 [Phycisphaerales bacterium]|nr:hypothetical protein [Phycisphaerales bacterium]